MTTDLLARRGQVCGGLEALLFDGNVGVEVEGVFGAVLDALDVHLVVGVAVLVKQALPVGGDGASGLPGIGEKSRLSESLIVAFAGEDDDENDDERRRRAAEERCQAIDDGAHDGFANA